MSESGSNSKSNAIQKNNESIVEITGVTSDVNTILRDAESIIQRNRLRFQRSSLNSISNTQTQNRTENRISNTVPSHEITELQNQIESLIESVTNNTANTLTSHQSPSQENQSNIVYNSNNRIEKPSSSSLNNNSSTSQFDDSVIFVNENVVEVIDLCSPRVERIRRRNLQHDDSVIIVSDFIESSPKKPKVQNINKEKDSIHQAEVKCPICLDCPLNNFPTTTPCGHLFCNACIKRALINFKKCPMCNRPCRPCQLIKIHTS